MTDKNLPLRIVVLQRGYIVVGRVERTGYMGSRVVIHGGACIRRWGTSEGLGELAASGPLPATVLDRQPVTRVHELTIVQEIDCDETAWGPEW